jgi:hypothetical protein
MDGILLDGAAKNILADRALSLWFTRHTRASLQKGDPAWALAKLQVNAQLKVAAAAVLRLGWRGRAEGRLCQGDSSQITNQLLTESSLKKCTPKSKQNLHKI